MADFFQSSPTFINPAYATPEQLATQRAYAEALTKRSGENVTRPTGAIANMITALTAGLERNRANELQSQAAEGNAANMSALIGQLQHGQTVDPNNLGRMIANPMVSPEQRALAIELMRPKAVEDVAGRPGYASPVQGVQAAPVQGAFQPGFRAPESAGSVSTTTPIPAPGIAPTGPAMPRPPVASGPKVWGDQEAIAAGLYPPTGAPQRGSGGGQQAPGAGTPPAPAPVVPGSRLDQLAAKDRELSAEKERTQGGAKAESGVIETDVRRAAAAPETLKGLGIMKNTIQSVGDQMTFGPTAKLSNEARRVIANYAPGLVDEKALAGADAIEKLNLGLAGSLSQQLGLNPSDIYRSVASVPGNEKSKAGTLALINMMEQAARNDQYVGTTLYQNSKGDLGAYQLARAAYYAHHPIVNPITGNAIDIDASKPQQGAQNAGPISVSTPEEARRLPKGTPIRLPDGRVGVVP
jgi:hypothetical protein